MKLMRAYDGLEIAIIGMSGQFPMSPDCNVFWQNLLAGKELTREYPDEELLKQGVRPEEIADSRFVKSAAVLDGKEYFDHRFFDYRPEEAAMMDPQIRMFHTHSWKALEDAGYASGREKQKIGLFATASDNDNWKIYRYLKAKEVSIDPYFLQFISNEKFLSSLTAYKLDLRGPVIYLDSACSSSLVAIHLACRSLLTRECNLALSGGVKIGTTIRKGYHYREGTILSPDGHCRTFDSKAGGTILGEGVGVVVLKRLADAIKNKDNIYAVIRSSAINNDGNDKVGYTAPSVKGQSECIRMAHKLAGIDPRTIGYIEAHGTATRLGDPMEIAALNNAFQTDNKGKYCAIGSVKSNMGHLDAAAGVAGLIKATLCLQHRKIVPSLHFQQPNPQINFNDGPFYVNTQLKDWPANGDDPIRAGVSSFGIGGTNAHVVLEEPPAKHRDPAEKSFRLLTLSAKNKTSLSRHIDELKAFIFSDPEINIDDIAFSYQVGRKHFNHRQAIVFEDREDLIRRLTRVDSADCPVAHAEVDIVFRFQDTGSQYVNMGRQLYEEEPLFRQEMDNGFRFLEALNGKNCKDIIYPAGTPTGEIPIGAYAQPILFIFQYALAKLIMSWGIKAKFMIGYGPGEYVVACLWGIFTFKDALRLVARTGYLVDSAPAEALDLILEDLAAEFKSVDFGTPVDMGCSMVCNKTGELVGADDLRSVSYWKSHFLRTADSSPAVAALLSSGGNRVFVEIGAGDKVVLSEMIGRLWMRGVDIDWNRFYGNHFRRRVSLPTYSFDPIRFPAEVEPFANGLPIPVELVVSGARAGDSPRPDNAGRKGSPDIGNAAAPSETSTERKVIELLEDFLDIRGLGADDDFFELGGESLKAMGFLIKIKSVFGVEPGIGVFFTDPTIRQLSRKIGECILIAGYHTDDHLVLLQPGKIDLTIFVIPGQEGDVLHFKEAIKGFENGPAIYGIQTMGLQEGERPLTTVGEIASQNIKWIKRLQPGGPYNLIGFSLGGLVVYEMIRQMESAGDQADLAVILDMPANAPAVVDHGETLAGLGCQILKKMGVIKDPYPDWRSGLKEVLSSMKRGEAIEHLIGFIREKSRYSGEDAGFWAKVLDVLFNNVLAIGPVSGRINGGLTIVRAAEENWGEADHDLGWSKHASYVEVFTVPGRHEQVFHNSFDKILEQFMIRSNGGIRPNK
jgi:acyl transferase domain-containing protein/thioesterase domain-containing protein